MQIDRTRADEMAGEVFAAAREALEHNRETGGLSAFAYAERALECWLVLETYKRIFPRLNHEADALGRPANEERWSSWPEVLLPGQKEARSHVDLFVGPHVEFPPKEYEGNYYDQPRQDAPVFELKFIRSDKLSYGLCSVSRDVDKILGAGLLHGYALLLHLVIGPGEVAFGEASERDTRLEPLSPECSEIWPAPGSEQGRKWSFGLEMLRMKG